MSDESEQFSRVRWRSRRGMMELDILLRRYLNQAWANADAGERTTYVRLLECEDTHLWPWLLGHYTDALLQTAWDLNGAVQGLLDTVRPLFCQHLCEAGLGSISEVFDGSPPYAPGGCTAQAWSDSELLRVWLKLGGK